jgi:ribosomal protein S18 acetylase RimI-like enzyme
MSQPAKSQNITTIQIDLVTEELSLSDLNDLCDATDAAIEDGGGFGWVKLPARDILERYWQGAIIMPLRTVFVARIDNTICGTVQMVHPPKHNEAQSHAVQLTSHFVAPWARGTHDIARMLVTRVEQQAKSEGYSVVNLDVRETQEAAIKLYESMGYERYATHPAYAYVNGHYVAGHYYMKILDAV